MNAQMAVLRSIVALLSKPGAGTAMWSRPGTATRNARAARPDWQRWLVPVMRLVRRGARGWRKGRAKTDPGLDPTLPATAQIVAVQHPSATLPARPFDVVLLGAVLVLLCIGTIEIYSTTAADGLTRFQDAAHFLERQIGFLVIGGAAMWFGARMDYRRLRKWTYPLLLGSMVLLAMTLATPTINGARRWIPLGPVTFQPVEIAKLALVTYLAYSLGRKADQVRTFTVGFVPHLVVCGMMIVVLLKQPDLGSSIVLGCTTLGLLFMAGARISYILLAVLAAAPIGYHMIVGTSWRLQRVLAYFNPEAYANGDAYQFLQARLAIGSGGLTGAGLGGGHQSLGYTPEAHSDFILAPIGEELGWLGVALVLGLFGVLVWRGIRAALGARDVFGGYLAFGITLLFGVQALFNVGVVLGFVPNKGITLPLVSCGGSSLVITMFLVGLLLNVGRRPERPARELPVRDLARKKRFRVRVVAA
jgi:cell division protein FtsW